MDKIFDLASILTLSGFSGLARGWAEKLAFPAVWNAWAPSEAIVWMVILLLALGPLKLLDSLALIGRCLTVRIHPRAVAVYRRGGKRISMADAEDGSLFILAVCALMLTFAYVFSLEAASISDALLLSAALYGNSGWLLLLIGKGAIADGYSAFLKLLMILLMLLGRYTSLQRIKKTLRRSKNRKH